MTQIAPERNKIKPRFNLRRSRRLSMLEAGIKTAPENAGKCLDAFPRRRWYRKDVKSLNAVRQNALLTSM